MKTEFSLLFSLSLPGDPFPRFFSPRNPHVRFTP